MMVVVRSLACICCVYLGSGGPLWRRWPVAQFDQTENGLLCRPLLVIMRTDKVIWNMQEMILDSLLSQSRNHNRHFSLSFPRTTVNIRNNPYLSLIHPCLFVFYLLLSAWGHFPAPQTKLDYLAPMLSLHNQYVLETYRMPAWTSSHG